MQKRKVVRYTAGQRDFGRIEYYRLHTISTGEEWAGEFT